MTKAILSAPASTGALRGTGDVAKLRQELWTTSASIAAAAGKDGASKDVSTKLAQAFQVLLVHLYLQLADPSEGLEMAARVRIFTVLQHAPMPPESSMASSG